MLDNLIIDHIIKRERKDTGWQPIPLYQELEIPRQVPPKENETSPSGPIEIDIWGPEQDAHVIQMYPYISSQYYF